MLSKSLLGQPKRRKSPPKSRKKVLHKLVVNDWYHRISPEQFREKVRDKYDGPQGALLAAASVLSMHTPLGNRLFRKRLFDLSGAKRILDVGSGAGQMVKPILKYADPGARLTCFDLSFEMLLRARRRLESSVPEHLVADLASLPFADASFDCITCGYVLEHLPDPRPGLAELSRVLAPRGRMLLLVTEDSFSGAWTSRIWCCRTYNRRDLHKLCQDVGLEWKKELWFTKMHKMLRAGGICVEIQKQ